MVMTLAILEASCPQPCCVDLPDLLYTKKEFSSTTPACCEGANGGFPTALLHARRNYLCQQPLCPLSYTTPAEKTSAEIYKAITKRVTCNV
jgi:hypothetical protein